MSDLADDFAEDILKLKTEMYYYIREVNDQLDEVIDEDTDIEAVEEPLQRGYQLYQQMKEVSADSLMYGKVQSERDDPHQYTQTREELLLDEMQIVDYMSMNESLRDYEEVLLRYIGIKEEIDIMEEHLQDILFEYDVDLPGDMDPYTFQDDETLE